METIDKKKYITASEIGDYIYCKRAWWLRTHGLLQSTPQMELGTLTHNNLAYSATSYSKQVLIIKITIGLGALLLISAIILLFTNQ